MQIIDLGNKCDKPKKPKPIEILGCLSIDQTIKKYETFESTRSIFVKHKDESLKLRLVGPIGGGKYIDLIEATYQGDYKMYYIGRWNDGINPLDIIELPPKGIYLVHRVHNITSKFGIIDLENIESSVKDFYEDDDILTITRIYTLDNADLIEVRTKDKVEVFWGKWNDGVI